MSITSESQYNHLLAVLPTDALQRMLGTLELIHVRLGQVLCEPEVDCHHVYFPTTAIVSLIYALENGNSAGIALVGNEGVVGISQFLGCGSASTRAVVQSAGKCMRITAESMKNEFKRSGPVMHALLRYTQALIVQTTQTAVCNRHHSIDQQLCLWLLRNLDRMSTSVLVTTQEQIANVMGVRREGITKATAKLESAGLIERARGHITVLDRNGIEDRACECYSVVRKEYERLFPYIAAA